VYTEVLVYIVIPYTIMNSAPVCSPACVNSDDGNVNGKLSTECSDVVDDSVPADNSIMNGCASANGVCEKSAESDSDDGCDGLSDGNPIHQLILHCEQTSSMSLDLSRRGLRSLCHKLFKLSNLQVIC